MPMHIDEQRLYTELGRNLRASRTQQDLTQTQVADAAGLLRTSVTNIEAGRQKAPLHVLYELCAALSVEPTALLPTLATVTGQEEPTSVPVHVDGEVKEVSPKAAAFLQQLIDEDTE